MSNLSEINKKYWCVGEIASKSHDFQSTLWKIEWNQQYIGIYK